jgi:hypothetical protein
MKKQKKIISKFKVLKQKNVYKNYFAKCGNK